MTLLLMAWLAFASGVPDLPITCRNAAATATLDSALNDPAYWNDADPKTYNNKLWDEIRLKPVDSGYVPMIAGEGGQDFQHEVVADIVFTQQDRLPRQMEGAKVVTVLGKGHDTTIGADYIDTFWVLDLTFFYAYYPQRMYRKKAGDRTVLWFEKMDSSFVPGPQWIAYEARMKKDLEEMDTRWAFNAVVPVDDIYGMFVVESGQTHESRITFVSKLAFGEDAGWLAKMGSKMPPVIRAGLKSGFEASVEIAKAEQERRQ